MGGLPYFAATSFLATLSRRFRRFVGLILHEILVALADPVPSGTGPRMCLKARPHQLRLRRQLSSAASGRVWVLELEVEVPAIDPEQLLAQCEEFLVDGNDGRRIGVVERVEKSAATGTASALLVSAGWVGRRHLRIAADAVEALVPSERRLIIDVTRGNSADTDDRRA